MAPRRRGWRYLATRLNGDGTETLLDIDVPLEDVTIEDVLSGDGSISGRIEPSYARLKGPDGLPLFNEWSTAIYAENDGVIRAGSILVDSDFEGPTWTLDCVGFSGYARDMPYTGGGYKGIRVDPIDVTRTIWNHIQARRGGNIALELGSTTTGGKVSIGTELRQVEFDTQEGPVSFEAGPYKLNWYTNHDLGGDIDTLAADTPFDYHERHVWDGDTIRHHLDIGYPKIGRRREDLRFVIGVNIFEPAAVMRNGAGYASGVMVLGAGEGASMKRAIYEPAERPLGRLRRIAVVADSGIKSATRAQRRAESEFKWRSQIDEAEDFIVRDHPNARLGAAQVGDEIRVEGPGEWVDLDMWVRILSITYQPETGNVAQYNVARVDKLTT